jgi:hypothetical protein
MWQVEDIEALNFDDLRAVAKLRPTNQYQEVMKVRDKCFSPKLHFYRA